MYVVHGALRETDASRTDQTVMYPFVFTDWPPPAVMDGQPFGVTGTMAACAVIWCKQYPDHTPAVISHIGEAWLARSTPGKAKPKGWSPSQDPDRIEAVIVSTHTIDQRISHSYREILRDEQGKCTGFGKDFGRQYVPGQPVDPRMTNDTAITAFFMAYLEMQVEARLQ